MIAEKDFEEIIEELLSYVPDDVDKRESSVIYQALAPVAMYLQEVYADLKYVWDGIFIDGLTGTDLDAKVAERALERKPATATLIKAKYEPTTVQFSGSERFSITSDSGEVIWFCQADTGEMYDLNEGEMLLVCETDGEVGNIPEGDLLPDTTVTGLERIYIWQILEYGSEEETDEALRQRYYDSFSYQTFGGNIADYEKWMLEQDGVEACEVVPFWKGVTNTAVTCNGGHAIAGGTVGIYFVASGYTKPTQKLIDTVQNAIDPPMYAGQGKGIAPIGHVVTIMGTEEEGISVATRLEFEDGYEFSGVKSQLEKTLDAYLTELSVKWGSTIVVRIAEIESRFLDINGVVDVGGTTINGAEQNYTLPIRTIPVREAVMELDA